MFKKIVTRYRYSAILLKQLVITDFKLRYQGSVLGYVWALLKPMALFVVLYVVFTMFLKVGEDIPHYPVYLLLGIVLWTFFAESTSGSIGSIVGKGDLMRKINFPKYVIVMAASFSALINLFLNFIVIAVFMVISGVDITKYIVLLPLIILELFVLSLSLGFILSAAFVRYRDISHIWEVVLQGLFYATPILYPISMLPPKATKLIILNPLAQIIQDARFVLISPQTPTISSIFPYRPWVRLLPLLFVAVCAVIATTYFRKRSKYFAEEV